MRLLASLLVSIWAVNAQVPAPKLWEELTAKRLTLPGFHQEFDVSQMNRSNTGTTQSHEWRIAVDLKGFQWREQKISGWGSNDRIFTGAELLTVDDGLGEFQRVKVRPRDNAPLPAPYSFAHDLDWSKASETGRQPCHNGAGSHTCVIARVPMERYSRFTGSSSRRERLEGIATLLIDADTGLLLEYFAVEAIQEGGSNCSCETHYLAKNGSIGAPPPTDAFAPLLTSLKEVKNFSLWDASHLKKALAGKPAPELKGIDLAGNTISLSSLKGKTVLLDFWAS